MFNRFDIMEVWHLFLSCYPRSNKRRKRLSKLQGYFSPRPDLSFKTLSDNGQCAYLALLKIELPELSEYPIVDSYFDRDSWYHMWINEENVYIRAKSFDDAQDALMDWCDHPDRIGHFTGITHEDIAECGPTYGYSPKEILAKIDADQWGEDSVLEQCRQAAEADMSMVNHTTLEHWDYKNKGMPGFLSWEWGGCQMTELTECSILNQRADEEEEDE
jgi:hypothetical protein